jgi:hypothetical protein
MSDPFVCGEPGALLAYLYDECEPEEREAIDAHLAHCASCSSELGELRATRRELAAWTPPATGLGFQLPVPASAAAHAPWWRAPLPAWAQAAAAMLIFGAGFSAGLLRGAPERQAVPATAAAVQESAVPAVEVPSRAELTAMEQRLKGEMSQLRAAAPAASPSPRSDDELLQRVQALIQESEERQRREFTIRSVELARDFETQRRVDLASVRQTLGQFQGVTGAEIRQQREAIDRINDYFVRVSQQGR